MSGRLCFFALAAAIVLAPRAAMAEGGTLVFDRPLFLDDKGATGKVKHLYRLDGVDGDWDASIAVILAGTEHDASLDATRWLLLFKTKTGAAADATHLALEDAAVKGAVTTLAGYVEERWTKAVSVSLNGPDGMVWFARLQGGAKTVDKHRDDFMKWVRSVKSTTEGGPGPKPAADEEDWRTVVARAKRLLDEGKGPAKVAPLVKRALELAPPDQPEVQALSGELLYLQRKNDEAYRVLSGAIKADGSLTRARRVRAYISIDRRLQGMQVTSEFLEDLDAAIEAYPDDLRLHDARARERYTRQKWREALVDFDVILAPEARKLGDKNVIADMLRARAYCHIKLRQFDKAIADCNDAIELSPKNGAGHRFLGILHMEHGDPSKAIDAFDAAAKLLQGEDRNDARILCIEAKEKTGDLAGAIADIEKFLEENPKSKFVKRATEALDRVRSANEKRLEKKDEKPEKPDEKKPDKKDGDF